MRTMKATVGFLAIFLLLLPAPAHAWWGWLDDLSGPGKFKGPQFVFRLFCFGEQTEVKRLTEDLKNADALTRKPFVGKNRDAQSLAIPRADALVAYDAWQQLIEALRATRLTFPVLDVTGIDALSEQVREGFTANEDGLPQQERITIVRDKIDTAFTNAQEEIAKYNRAISFLNSTGIFLSACSTDTKRRSSIELGMNFWYANASPNFANNEQIRLTTLMPEFSFRVFTDPRFDVLDAGVGAGVYWFTSKGFDSVSGVVLEPGRLDFHAPTVWSTPSAGGGLPNLLRRLAAVPTFRFAVIDFPAGFSPDAFAGTPPDHHVRIPGELVKSWSIFINLDPFVRKAPFLK